MNNEISIWHEEQKVGEVYGISDESFEFRYAERWLESPGTFPISVTMPLRPVPYPAEIILTWLTNLLPEDENLMMLKRSLGVSSDDVLTILAEIGGDTAGALSFGIPSDRRQWKYASLTDFYGTNDEKKALEIHMEDLGRRPFLVGEEGVRQSLAGGQKKSTLAVLGENGKPVLRLPRDGDVLAIPLFGAPSTIIVKPDNTFLPGIIENEVWCLRMAQAIGINATQATILQSTTRKAIGVLRYDRNENHEGGIERLHQEDFAQANTLMPGRKYERGVLPGLNYKSLIATGRHVSAIDALALLDQVIFNILVANADAHAKNYSFLIPPSAKPQLSPLYDVTAVLPWPHIAQEYAQDIAGKKHKPNQITKREWNKLAEEINVSPSGLKKRVLQLAQMIIKNKAKVTGEVILLPGALKGFVTQVADEVVGNVKRVAERTLE